jgi:hypothetical protein
MKGTKKVNVFFRDEYECEVKGYYIPSYPCTREEPEQSAEFEIETIIYKGVDILDLFHELSEDAYLELQEKCIEKIIDEQYQDVLDE